MKNLTNIFSVIIILIFYCFSQLQAQIKFQSAIGGTASDIGYSIIQTSDGSYIMTGTTESAGNGRYGYIVKYSNFGTFVWDRYFGVSGYDYIFSVVQLQDGGYVTAGYNNSQYGSGGYDIFIVKISSNGGGVQWGQTIACSPIGNNMDEIARCMIKTPDGFVIAGWTNAIGYGNQDCFVVKLLGSSGGVAFDWAKSYGGTAQDEANSIIQTTDSGYAVAGCTYSFGNIGGHSDFYIIKISARGTIQWTRTAGWANDEVAYSIVKSTDGGYVVAGSTNSIGNNTDAYIVKLNGNGGVQWAKNIGGPNDDAAYSIINTSDGGYVFAGVTYSFGTNGDIYIVKLNSEGTILWSKAVGGYYSDYANSVIQTTDGGYALVGRTSSFGNGGGNIYFVKLDSNGNSCGSTISASSTSGNGTIYNSGGNTSSPIDHQNRSQVLVHGSLVYYQDICNSSGIVNYSGEIPGSYLLYQNCPNPFNPATKIKFDIPKPENGKWKIENGLVSLKVFDVIGKEIETLVNEKLNPGTYEVTFNASQYPSGVYFYRLTTDGYNETKKMLLIK